MSVARLGLSSLLRIFGAPAASLFLSSLFFSSLFFSSVAVAAIDTPAAEALAKSSGCNKCHVVEKKKDGPAFRDVAANFRGDAEAPKKIHYHITSGEKVKFDDGHEEEHKKVKSKDEAAIRNLIDWILSLEGGAKYTPNHGQ